MLKDLIKQRDTLIKQIADLKDKKSDDEQAAMLALALRKVSKLTTDEQLKLSEYNSKILREIAALESEKKKLTGGSSTAEVKGFESA